MLVDEAAARAFFASLPDEDGGPEPDWEDQRAALVDSRVAGLPGT